MTLCSLYLFFYIDVRQHKIYCRVDWIIMRPFAGRQGWAAFIWRKTVKEDDADIVTLLLFL